MKVTKVVPTPPPLTINIELTGHEARILFARLYTEGNYAELAALLDMSKFELGIVLNGIYQGLRDNGVKL